MGVRKGLRERERESRRGIQENDQQGEGGRGDWRGVLDRKRGKTREPSEPDIVQYTDGGLSGGAEEREMGMGENKGEEYLLVSVCGQCSSIGGKRRGYREYDEKAGRVFRGEEATSKCGKDSGGGGGKGQRR